jgi:hypothetical protein
MSPTIEVSRPERAAKKSACGDDAGGAIDTRDPTELNAPVA